MTVNELSVSLYSTIAFANLGTSLSYACGGHRYERILIFSLKSFDLSFKDTSI